MSTAQAPRRAAGGTARARGAWLWPRGTALGLVLLAVYAATVSIPAAGGERYAGDEPHYLLAARSWARDGDLDLTNQYAERQWREFAQAPVRPSGKPVQGRLHEPQGTGLPLLLAPAYALGGARAVVLLLAAVTALGFVLAAVLARRLVPEPWASAAALLAGLSPPAVAAATAVSPQPLAGTALAGAAWYALKVRERARLRYAYGAALLLAVLPWLAAPLILVAIPVGACLVAWTLAERRRLVALLCGELLLGSLVFYARVNETLYGGPTPASAGVPGGDGLPLPVGWAANLVRIWLDPRFGLLRWAPVLALAFAGAWLLWRSRRGALARAIPERREAERAGGLLAAVAGVQWIVAAFGSDPVEGPWFPGLPMAAALPAAAALAAWGLRRAPRTGAALGALTLVATAYVVGDAWLAGGDWAR